MRAVRLSWTQCGAVRSLGARGSLAGSAGGGISAQACVKADGSGRFGGSEQGGVCLDRRWTTNIHSLWKDHLSGKGP